MNHASPFRVKIPFHPWVYFSLFLFSNALICYFPLSLSTKLWIGIFGLFLPFLVGLQALLGRDRPSQISSFKKPHPSVLFSSKETVPSWAWALLFFLLILVRFYKLTSLPFWPIGDEGIFSFLASAQLKEWHWNLLWTPNRLEPLMIWLLGVFFKLITPSFFSIRLFPLLISLMTSLAFYWAARQYFSVSLSFIFCWIFSFSFWEMTLSRSCLAVILVPFFLAICSGLFGIYLRSLEPSSKRTFLLLLGLFAGLGFYTYPNWVMVWLFLIGVLWFLIFKINRGAKFDFWIFFGMSIATAIPLLAVRLAPWGMVHYKEYFSGFSAFKNYFLYTTAIFWDGLDSFPYGPVWGGFLDPVTTTLVLMGILEAAQKLEKKIMILFFFAISFFMLPGVLSNNIELHRIDPALLGLTLLAAFGIQSLMTHAKKVSTWGAALPILGLSLALNLFHFFGPYCDPALNFTSQEWRSTKYSQIHKILEQKSRESGPLYVFSEFNLDYVNKTLEVTDFPYNVLQNPAALKNNPQWAALLVSMDYRPYLQERFQHLDYEPLPKALPASLGLFLIPLSDFTNSVLPSWIAADRVCRDITWKVINRNPSSPIGQFADQFNSFEDKFKTDPFLSCLYWEKIAFLKSAAGDYQNAARACQKAIQTGIQTPRLYYRLGQMLDLAGENTKAVLAFQKAKEMGENSGPNYMRPNGNPSPGPQGR